MMTVRYDITFLSYGCRCEFDTKAKKHRVANGLLTTAHQLVIEMKVPC